MPTQLMRPQERLRQVVEEANNLAIKGVLDKNGNIRLAELITEGQQLREQIEQQDRLGDLDKFAAKSGGLLPLATPGSRAMTVASTPAGETAVKYSDVRVGGRKIFNFEILDQYGEGIYSQDTTKAWATDDYRQAFRKYIRGGKEAVSYTELKTLQEGADTSGGFAVPADILDRVIAREPTPTRVSGRITQLQTSRDQLIIPKVVWSTDDLYTTGMRVTWTGEIPASATTARVTEPVFGQVSIPVYTAMMSIPITNDMIEDASFPIVSYVSGKFGETIDLLRDNMILNGSALGQPSGILVNPGGGDSSTQPATVKSTAAANVAAAGFVATAFALPEQYDDGAAWVMNKTNTGATLAGLTDSYGRYIWSYGFQDSGLAPDWHGRNLLGYPIVWSGFMPNQGSNAYPVIFGDLSGYYLVNRIGFSVQVLRELYAETNQILLLGRIRFGGLTAEPWKIKAMICST